MTNFAKNFIQYVRKKIYNAVVNHENEENKKRTIAFIHSLKQYGGDLIVNFDETRINGPEFIEIGKHCYFGKNAWVEAIGKYNDLTFLPSLKIGDNFSMQYNCHIGCIESIEIGNNVLLGSKVYITDHFHGNITKDDIDVPPILRPLSSKPVKIGDNVWIGDNVCIMPGVTLGRNVIVGANAVVTKSFPDNTVIAGVPARIIKTLL